MTSCSLSLALVLALGLKLYDRTPEGGPSACIRRLHAPDQRLSILYVFALELEAWLLDLTGCIPCALRARLTY